MDDNDRSGARSGQQGANDSQFLELLIDGRFAHKIVPHDQGKFFHWAFHRSAGGTTSSLYTRLHDVSLNPRSFNFPPPPPSSTPAYYGQSQVRPLLPPPPSFHEMYRTTGSQAHAAAAYFLWPCCSYELHRTLHFVGEEIANNTENFNFFSYEAESKLSATVVKTRKGRIPYPKTRSECLARFRA